MWQVEDALEGRLSVGKSRNGSGNEECTLRMSGKRLYQLQKFLEEEAEKGGVYFRVRMCVVLAEELREAVSRARAQKSEARLLGAAQAPSLEKGQEEQGAPKRREHGEHL
jgi:hypothetical protein